MILWDKKNCYELLTQFFQRKIELVFKLLSSKKIGGSFNEKPNLKKLTDNWSSLKFYFLIINGNFEEEKKQKKLVNGLQLRKKPFFWGFKIRDSLTKFQRKTKSEKINW